MSTDRREPARRADLPAGTVTFLFTDVEGSTALLHQFGAEAYADALAEHRRIVREACDRHGGVEVDTQGDAFFVAFPDATGAVAAAREISEALADGPIRVRMGIHTGTPVLTAEGYIGPDVHKGARIAAAGHGGQVLLSAETRSLLGDEATELGEHRLKDFAAAVPIYQLGDERFPPLKTISNTNLPRPASRFVGREREVADIRSRLTDSARLLTLTGPGGTGKTRLAIEAAAELVPEFKAGVFWVPLASLRDATLVTQTIGDTLGAKGGLEAHIGEREMLLLLDNLEQVVDAAPKVASLVEACPNLRVLATSRARLRVRGEAEYPVPPLADSEAVEMFCARAQMTPDESVHQLCRALENLPLAIELAAARVSVLSPQQILERLSRRLDLLKGGRDADPRQHTLRATIEWSYELLDTDERRLFARLSVLRGGCTLDAAESVVDADLDTVQSLVDKSLLRRRDERFWMLETVREYAAERLLLSEEAETIRNRHLDHLIALAERAYEERFELDSKWLPLLDAERDNIRAALEWAGVARPNAEAQLAGAVAYYWNWRGYGGEARTQVGGALARYPVRDGIRARALTHYAELGNVLGSSEQESLGDLREALEICREQGDPLGEGLALELIGYTHQAAGDDEASRRALDESLAVRARAGAPELASARARAGLCALLVSAGDAERAERMATELYELGVKYNARRSKQSALHYLADCPLLTGDYEEAERRYMQALVHAQESGILAQRTEELLGVAMSKAGQGDHARAVTLAEAAYAQQRREARTGANPRHFWARFQERFIGGARARLSPEELEAAERAGREADFDAVVENLLQQADVPSQSRMNP